MLKGLIIRRLAGHALPEEYLKKAIEAFPSCMGAALVHDGELQVQQMMEKPTLEAFQAIEKEFKNSATLYYLGNFPKDTPETELQPFAVIGETDNVEVVVACEGDFTSYQRDKGSAEYNFVAEFMGEQLGEDYTAVGENLTKLVERLGSKKLEGVINAAIGNRGNVCVLTKEDKLITWGQNELRKVFPWGWVSQHLGYAEGVAEKPKEEAPKAAGKKLLFGGGKPKSDATPAPSPDPNPKPQTETAPLPQKTQEQIEAEDTNQWGSLPSSLRKKNNGAIKDWYRNNCADGQTGNDWRMFPKRRLKNLKTTPIETFENETAMKAALEKATKDKAEADAKAAVSTTMSKEEIAKASAWIDNNKVKTPTPDEIMAREKDALLFTDAVGRKPEDMFRYDKTMFLKIGKDLGLKALADAAFQGWQLLAMERVTKPDETPEVPGEPLPAGAPAQPASPAPEQKPTGKKLIFGKRAA